MVIKPSMTINLPLVGIVRTARGSRKVERERAELIINHCLVDYRKEPDRIIYLKGRVTRAKIDKLNLPEGIKIVVPFYTTIARTLKDWKILEKRYQIIALEQVLLGHHPSEVYKFVEQIRAEQSKFAVAIWQEIKSERKRAASKKEVQN